MCPAAPQFFLFVSFYSKSSQHTLGVYISSIQPAQNLIALLIMRVGCPKTSVQAASGSMSNAILSSTLFFAPLWLNTSFPGACTVLSLPFPQDVGRISASECCPHHDGLPSLWKHDANSLEGRLLVIDPGCLGFAAIDSRGAAPGFTATVV